MFIKVGKVGKVGGIGSSGGASGGGTLLYVLLQKISNYKGDVSQFQLVDSENKELLDNGNNNLWVGGDNLDFSSQDDLDAYLSANFNSDSGLTQYQVQAKNQVGNILDTKNLNNNGYRKFQFVGAYATLVLDITGPNNFHKIETVQISLSNNCIFLFV